ncbi:MAG: response regulator [Clostridia bacterium]|nr:response regulator [Clostridia bacterium]
MEHAEDGQICVDMLCGHQPGYYDLILMDIQMPNLNGYDATKKIRSLPDEGFSRIPILAMTANAFDEDKKKAIAMGMNGHLAKPIDVKQMMEKMAGLIG